MTLSKTKLSAVMLIGEASLYGKLECLSVANTSSLAYSFQERYNNNQAKLPKELKRKD
jgi:hypothetical protein